MSSDELAEFDPLKAEEMILSTKLAVKVDQRQRLMAQNEALRAQLAAQAEIVEEAKDLYASWQRVRASGGNQADYKLDRLFAAVERSGT